jgi:tetratricopeptide (TPR) repeat protein
VRYDPNPIMNSVEQLLYQASLELEERQDVERALDLLHEAMMLAQIAGRELELIRVKTFLGELLAQIDQPGEALKEFSDVVRLAAEYPGAPEDVDAELTAARTFIDERDPGH